MAIASKIAALFNTMTASDLEAMAPIERRGFAQLCQHWGQLAERQRRCHIDLWRSGVLADLRQGYRCD